MKQPVTSLEQELQMRIEWLERGLKEIVNHYSHNDVPKEARDIAQAYIDGEPTTADRYNRGDDVEYKYGK